jgi:hypothetical protein
MMLSPVLQLFDPRSHQVRELDRHAARLALIEHRLAVVDPPRWDMVAIAWWALRPDYDAPRDRPRLVGPEIHFDPSRFTAPVLPIGGVTVA